MNSARPQKLSTRARLGIGITVFAFAMAATLWQMDRQMYQGPRGGDFTLESKTGKRRLSDIQNGRPAVLYFGFTSCPDVCPMSLHKLAQALKQLSLEEREKIRVVFVSVDHQRDTASKTQTYVEAFIPGGVGLTGSKAEIDAVVNQYGATYVIEPDAKSALGYGVQHTTSFFLVNRSHRLVTRVPEQMKVEDLAMSLKSLL